jgi:hypothetical protein
MISSIIVGVIGIISTLLAWFLNPKRAMYAELDSIQKNLEQLYVKRDEALAKNDVNAITDISALIVGLRNRKNEILQRK